MFQCRVRMFLIVMFKLGFQLFLDYLPLGPVRQQDLVSVARSHIALGNAIVVRTLHISRDLFNSLSPSIRSGIASNLAKPDIKKSLQFHGAHST